MGSGPGRATEEGEAAVDEELREGEAGGAAARSRAQLSSWTRR